jgi:hypothetical protein
MKLLDMQVLELRYEDLREGHDANHVLHFKLCLPCFRNSAEATLKNTNIQAKNDVLNFKDYSKRMKTCSLCLWICRGAGFFGMSLLARTLIPGYLYRLAIKTAV